MRWLSPPRQRARGAIEVEIVEPDVVEEAEPLDDLLQDTLGDLLLLVVQMLRHLAEEFERGADRAAGGHRDVLPGDLDRARLGLEPRAVAHLAGPGGLVFAQLLAHPRAVGREHAALEIADHALERLLDLIALAPVHEP